MADEPLTLAVLARFSREVLAPQFGQIEKRLDRLDEQMLGHFDAIYRRFDKLETEYQVIVVGLRRVEEQLGVLAEDKRTLRSELQDLRIRVDALQGQIRAIEERLDT
jgi:predicted  nucleic acid-binding Zn-ribbon protein